MLKKLSLYGLVIALMAMPLLFTACSERKNGNVVGPEVSESPLPDNSGTSEGEKKPGTINMRLSSDNRTSIQYECYYALRQNWGYISWYNSIDGTVQRSSWAYLLSDPNAHAKAVEWYGADASMWKNWPSYYSNMDVYSWTALNRSGGNTGTTRSHGGQCRSFAALILYRAGARSSRLPSYGGSARPYYQIRVGDVIETNTVNGHTAIVVGIAEGSPGTSVRKVVVVDSNYIGDEEIGMHVLAVGGLGVNGLQNYRVLNLGY